MAELKARAAGSEKPSARSAPTRSAPRFAHRGDERPYRRDEKARADDAEQRIAKRAGNRATGGQEQRDDS